MNDFKAGTFADRSCYMSFQPSDINLQWQIKDMKVMELLEEVGYELATLNTLIKTRNGERFEKAIFLMEAICSVRLAHFKINLEEYMQNKAGIMSDKSIEVIEVDKYIATIRHGMELMKEIPFSTRLIKGLHQYIQLESLSHNLLPGAYRTSQTWVGGASLHESDFIPPVPSTIPGLMSDLELFVNNNAIVVPNTIRVALMHYQMQVIHPFLDANGRLARLLIPLYLMSRGMLSTPMLITSSGIERTKDEYIERQRRMRERGEVEEWFIYFLKTIKKSTEITSSLIFDLTKWHTEYEGLISKLGIRAKDARLVLNFIYENGVITPFDVEHLIGKSNVTAYKLISDLEQMGLMHEFSGQERNRVYILPPLNIKNV